MKKADVKIGETYAAKVSGRIVHVRIDGVSAYGGWNATNLETKRVIRVKSAQRLRDVREADEAAARVRRASEALRTQQPFPVEEILIPWVDCD